MRCNFFNQIQSGILMLALWGSALVPVCSFGDTVSNAPVVVKLRLNEYLHQVLQHNELLQAQMFGSEADRRKWKAQWGDFEPQLKLSFTREANRRTNNIQQQATLSGQNLFDERNNIYNGGVESLLPTGAKVNMGYTLRDLVNNVNPYGSVFTSTNNAYTQQYETFVGVTFTQPLLKNGGIGVTLAALRLAAADSEIGFQQYRRQLMMTVARAEAAYWNMYFAQEQMRFFDDSVAVAKNVLEDSRHKLTAGQGAELDVMEAQSGLALRQTKLNEARQNYYDAIGNMQSLAGMSPPPLLNGPPEPTIRVVDVPSKTNAIPTYVEGLANVFRSNPDYLIQRQKLKEDELRLGVAKNQMLPELDFKAAYGYNGLSATPGGSWSATWTEDTPSWSVGVELTVPLGGNIKGRNLAASAKASLQAAYDKLCGTQTEVANQLRSAIRKTRAWEQSIGSYQTVVDYNKELLKTDFARLRAGTVSSHDVLQVEADLLDARQSLANALAQYQESQMHIELASGTILKRRHLEVTRKEVSQLAAEVMRHQEARSEALFKE